MGTGVYLVYLDPSETFCDAVGIHMYMDNAIINQYEENRP